MTAHPTIAFLTDFGTSDHYVGAMKGAALSVCPDATLVDITHEVDPQDVVGGAHELAAAYRYFPAGTIFVAVVDPGVGTSRKGIAASAAGYRFVAPDNGLLTLAFNDAPPDVLVELRNPRFARATVSRTFEGRDRFAPAAAWLATGVELLDLGPALTDYQRIDIPVPHLTADAIVGAIIRVDRFGNLVTNIDRKTVERFASGKGLRVTAGPHEVGSPVGTYSDVVQGSACALFGSSDHLEVAVAGGSAAEHFGLSRGTVVVVSRT